MASTTDTLHINTDKFRYEGAKKLHIDDAPTKVEDLYEDSDHYEALLRGLVGQLNKLQEKMYAHNRYGLLALFQAMDAAGKDSTIQHVFSGVNPLGLRVNSFKQPSRKELEHDFLWRTQVELPERGTIGIFNRSYYEEVLVVKVHPEILTQNQLLPEKETKDMDKLWKNRYRDIRHMESYLRRNGFPTLKFFLHVSKEEQADRLIKRIEEPDKNWKFDAHDVEERGYWDEYMKAYEEMINKTASHKAPWFIIPADDKKNMRLIVAKILVDELSSLDMAYPEVNEEQHQKLLGLVEVIQGQNEE